MRLPLGSTLSSPGSSGLSRTPRAVAVDALSCKWEDNDIYAFPPSPLISKVLIKLESFTGEMTLIAPLAPHSAWFTLLVDRMTQPTLQMS